MGAKRPPTQKQKRGLCPHKTVIEFLSPVRRLDISPTSGGLGEHCLSSAAGHVLCALLGRVAQPRLLAKYRGNPAGAANRGRLLWVTFLGKTRKVTCCRAIRGGFRWVSLHSTHPTQAAVPAWARCAHPTWLTHTKLSIRILKATKHSIARLQCAAS